jgi:diaminopimelate decarboxylase
MMPKTGAGKAIHHVLRSSELVTADAITVGGHGLALLAERAGTTPFYAYDRELIRRRVAMTRGLLAPSVGLNYAVKANPMPAVVSLLAGIVDGFDVASGGELRTVLDVGADALEVTFAGPGKRRQEIRAAIASGVTIHLESEGEFETVMEEAESVGRAPALGVRVNPEFEARGARLRMATSASQFGVDAVHVPRLLDRIQQQEVKLRGLHVYSGSQNLDAESLVVVQNLTIEMLLRLADGRDSLDYLNVGGGFGVPYFPADVPLDFPRVAENLNRRANELFERHGARLILELGRYLTAEAGVFVTRVVDRKLSGGEVFLVVDGGLNSNLAASGNLGQIIRRSYPIASAERVLGGVREVVNIVGPLCTPIDRLGKSVEIAQMRTGDLVAVLQCGAYGFSASPHLFLSHPAPLEMLV